MKLSNLVAAAVASAVLGVAGAASAAVPVYVGSWFVDDGPSWTGNPPVYSGQEAAAFLFGGVASDYVISTISSDVADINYMAFYDGWGDDQTCGLAGPCSQSLHVDVDNDGYENPYDLGAAYSAYVYDHQLHLQNFAFRVDSAVPEPAAWALMIGGFGLAGSALRRRRTVAVAA